jgi:uncharacterized membrane protein (GlpM family)
MFLELAKPIALMSCILSLYAVLYTAFLNPTSELDQKIYDSLSLLALSAVISIIGGLIFREAQRPSSRRMPLRATLPVQVFCWALAAIVIFFLLSWYLEIHGIFYRDVRPNV